LLTYPEADLSLWRSVFCFWLLYKVYITVLCLWFEDLCFVFAACKHWAKSNPAQELQKGCSAIVW